MIKPWNFSCFEKFIVLIKRQMPDGHQKYSLETGYRQSSKYR